MTHGMGFSSLFLNVYEGSLPLCSHSSKFSQTALTFTGSVQVGNWSFPSTISYMVSVTTFFVLPLIWCGGRGPLIMVRVFNLSSNILKSHSPAFPFDFLHAFFVGSQPHCRGPFVPQGAGLLLKKLAKENNVAFPSISDPGGLSLHLFAILCP